MSCGTRAQDFRPGDPDGARLLRSSLEYRLLDLLHCALRVVRTFGGLSQRHPSTAGPVARPACCFGLEPHRRTSRCARPQPTPSPRYCSPTPLPGTATCTYRYCIASTTTLPAVTPVAAGHPVRPSVPSPSHSNRGFGTPPPNRPAHCEHLYCRPAVRSLPGPSVSLGYERNNSHTTTQCLLSTQQILRCPKRRQSAPASGVPEAPGLRPGGGSGRPAPMEIGHGCLWGWTREGGCRRCDAGAATAALIIGEQLPATGTAARGPPLRRWSGRPVHSRAINVVFRGRAAAGRTGGASAGTFHFRSLSWTTAVPTPSKPPPRCAPPGVYGDRRAVGERGCGVLPRQPRRGPGAASRLAARIGLSEHRRPAARLRHVR